MSILLIYLVNLLILGGLVWWLYRQAWTQKLRPYFWLALGLKLLLALTFAIFRYSYANSSDTHVYHAASLQLMEYAGQHPSAYLRLLFFNQFESEAFRASLPFSRFPDFTNSFYFVKLLSVLNLLTAGAYYLNNLYLSLFSFWGSLYLVSVLTRVLPKYKSAAVAAFLFFPSVVFWSTGVMKEPVMFGSMCWVVGAALQLAQGQKLSIWTWLLLPLQVYVFIKIKLFYAGLLLPLLLAYVLVQRLKVYVKPLQSPRVQLLLLLALAGVVVLVVMWQRSVFNPDFILWNLERNYSTLLSRSQHRPHINLHDLEPTLLSMLLHYPEAALSSIYRPFLGESWRLLYLLSGLENLLLLLLTALAVASAFRNGASRRVALLHVLLLVFILCMAGVTGLSTPNFGTLSRYRIVYLPFLVYLLLQNVYAQRLLQRLRFP
ncbi:hypothetical protein [Pontibacter chinhatensis]|uniref:Dolichyl-phosphate-mannose-protein mannosyltransferase n=1 Tax=Pontibacter chinhatensis TaxID=1436961 RepID=A0A1I2YIZ8_9BACT|nr:hypothetical protein [Pontibacter chinhatensis]SFH25319.1 hypothetical protein SAMN05421739_10891 [Pontibacter chinhatensis]